jgi:hypothetical protein
MSTLAHAIATHPEHARDQAHLQLAKIAHGFTESAAILASRAITPADRLALITEMKTFITLATSCNLILQASDAAAAALMQQAQKHHGWLL